MKNKKIKSSANRLRMSVYRSNTNIYTQLIDDQKGHTVVSASSLGLGRINCNIEIAKKVGSMVAIKALSMGIESVVFDRGGYKFHGQVKSLAEGARGEGLKF